LLELRGEAEVLVSKAAELVERLGGETMDEGLDGRSTNEEREVGQEHVVPATVSQDLILLKFGLRGPVDEATLRPASRIDRLVVEETRDALAEIDVLLEVGPASLSRGGREGVPDRGVTVRTEGIPENGFFDVISVE
jgi:hypothetical protein